MKAVWERVVKKAVLMNGEIVHRRLTDKNCYVDMCSLISEIMNSDYEFQQSLRTHNEKIARAALETGFAQGYSREGFGSKQEYDEYVEMKLSAFLQSPEYKELVGGRMIILAADSPPFICSECNKEIDKLVIECCEVECRRCEKLLCESCGETFGNEGPLVCKDCSQYFTKEGSAVGE